MGLFKRKKKNNNGGNDAGMEDGLAEKYLKYKNANDIKLSSKKSKKYDVDELIDYIEKSQEEERNEKERIRNLLNQYNMLNESLVLKSKVNNNVGQAESPPSNLSNLNKENRIDNIIINAENKDKKAKKSIKAHIHKNNIIKNQLIGQIKQDGEEKLESREIERDVLIKKKSRKIAKSQAIDKTSLLINQGYILDPKELSREFDKIGDDEQAINKVISERIKNTIKSLRKNKFTISRSQRYRLFTDLSIIDLAIERGFRPKYLMINKRLMAKSAYDNSVTLSECLKEIAWLMGKKDKPQLLEKIDEIVIEEDLERYVLGNLNNPMGQLKEIEGKLELTQENQMELERKL